MRATRERRQLTQEDVAAHLGVPRSAVSDIEASKREISAVELVALARLFGESLEDLVGLSREPADGELVMLRAAEVTPTARRQINHWIHLCDAYAQLEEWLNERRQPDLRPVDRILSTYEDARGLAEDERNRLGLGVNPGHELVHTLEERLGVKVFFLPLDDSISGASMVSDRFGPAILVNRNHPPGRRTFTLAHEYFHLLTPGRVAGSGGRTALQLCEAGAKDDRAEKLADKFAGQILIPPAHFVERVRQLLRPDQTIDWMDLIELARYFGVSVSSVFLEMAAQKFVPWDVAKEAYANPEVQARLTEALTGGTAEPMRFRRLAAKAYRAEHISRSRLAELFDLNVAEVGDELRRLGAEDGGGGLKISLPR